MANQSTARAGHSMLCLAAIILSLIALTVSLLASTGAIGATDKTMTQNTNGARGPAGAEGTDGQAGPAGMAGIDGDRGPGGATGPQGATGPTGVTGPQGATGPTGVGVAMSQAIWTGPATFTHGFAGERMYFSAAENLVVSDDVFQNNFGDLNLRTAGTYRVTLIVDPQQHSKGQNASLRMNRFAAGAAINNPFATVLSADRSDLTAANPATLTLTTVFQAGPGEFLLFFLDSDDGWENWQFPAQLHLQIDRLT